MASGGEGRRVAHFFICQQKHFNNKNIYEVKIYETYNILQKRVFFTCQQKHLNNKKIHMKQKIYTVKEKEREWPIFSSVSKNILIK